MDRRFWRIALAWLALLGSGTTPVMAQLGVAPFGADDEMATQYAEPVFLAPDRRVLRMLNTAQQLLEQGRYAEAVRALSGILNSDEDYFYTLDNHKRNADDAAAYEAPPVRSLKSEARRLIGLLPKAARDSYELQFGAKAQRMLDRAIETGDIEALSDVARSYFHTQAGYDAVVLLGRYQMDQGRPLAAALCFQQVYDTQEASRYEPMLSLLTAACWRQAGDETKASQILSVMQSRTPNAAFQLGGKPVPLFRQPNEALDWLTQLFGQSNTVAPQGAIEWVMFRGNPSRSGVSVGGRPLLSRPLWKQRILVDSDLEKELELERQQYADTGTVAVPAMQPLALGDVILMRTPGRIAAVNFESGKLQWQVETSADTSLDVDANDEVGTRLSQQIWLDKTYGTMSSDGDRVFVVEPRSEQVIVDRAGNRRLDINPVNNLLAAYDVSRSQGKLAWSVGGPSEGDEELRQAFFLGPPLPLQGRLYVLAELGGEIRLVVLNALTGKHLWSQQLAVVQPGGAEETQRRTGGISPSFSEGVLICPTGVGAVVAVDLTTRSLLWGYQYPETDDEPYINRGWGMSRRATPPEPEEMWADCCAVISNGRLVITPAESDQMHCLNLSDGSLQWQIEREDDTDRFAYLACVSNDKAIVVGREHVSAIDMVSGKVVENWPLKLPEASVPCGRGYHAGRYYYLPLNSPGGGEVAIVDLDEAKIAGRARSRNESVPGNLIAYRDQIVSQNTDWLQVYFQFEKLKERVDARLKADPADPWALVRRGEMLTDQGTVTEAVPLFRQARSIYKEKGEEFVADRLLARDLLLAALLENLDNDFAAHRDSTAEIEGIVESVGERIDYLRILAKGQEEAGDVREALRSYFQLADTAQRAQPLLKIDSIHSVRLDRWLRSRLNRLQAKLDDEQLAVFNAEIDVRREHAVKEDTVAALQGFLNYFAAHASSEEVSEKLVAKMPDTDDRLARVELLRRLATSSNPDRQRAAVAQLAELYLDAGQFREAAHYFDRLRSEWPDQVCWNDKTGQQLFDDLPKDSPARQPKFVEYPFGQVSVVQGSGNRPSRSVSYQPGFPLQMLSRRNPTLERTSVVVDQRQRYNVIGMDEYGNPGWTVSLLDGINQRNFMINYGLSCGRMDGSLLILSVGHQVMAIDTLRAKAGSGRPVLWRQDVTQHINAAASRFIGRRRTTSADPPPWGDDAPNQFQIQQTLARLGPITPGGVTFLRNRDLVSVDPITGETLWLRRGVTRDVELFGDDQYVFVVEPGETDALILDAMDGSEIGHAILPQPESRWTTVGRQVLTWRKPSGVNSRRELVLRDPMSASDVWVHEIGRGAKGTLIDDEAVAIMDRDGHFRIIDMETGDALVDQMLEPEPTLRGVYVIASREHFIVVTNRGADYQDKRNAHLQPMPQQHGSALVTGRVYAFNRATGQPRWQVPAEIQQHGLVLNQPPELPVVVFARRETETRRNRQSLSFLFLDKRTGRLVVPPQTLNRTEYNFEVAGDRDGKMVTVFFQNRGSNFSLEFTDEPVPPEPPLQAEGEHGTGRITSFSKALDAFRRAAESGPLQKKDIQKLFEVKP